MRKLLLVAGFAAAALIPSMASAQTSCGQQRDNQVVGTVAGAGLGALLGSAIAPRGDRGAGAVIGAVGGGIVGNQVTKPGEDCSHAYGYYDRNNQWHANNVDRADARGYYNRDGAWVDGAPDGYYDGGGRWVAASNDGSAGGYYDARGRWVPNSAGGYYDDGGQWVASESGYYNQDGRWVSGQTSGAYDASGRWMPGARTGHADVNGVWIADAQPGYWDSNHRWRAGPARGYYDTRGVWIATAVAASGADVSFDSGRDQGGMRRDVDTRESMLEQRIRTASTDGTLGRRDASQAFGQLNSIRHQERDMRRYSGQLSSSDEQRLQDRLDQLSASLRTQLRGDGF